MVGNKYFLEDSKIKSLLEELLEEKIRDYAELLEIKKSELLNYAKKGIKTVTGKLIFKQGSVEEKEQIKKILKELCDYQAEITKREIVSKVQEIIDNHDKSENLIEKNFFQEQSQQTQIEIPPK